MIHEPLNPCATPRRLPSPDTDAVAETFCTSGTSPTVRGRSIEFELPRWFELDSGYALDSERVNALAIGPADAPAIAVLGGISASADPTSFWPRLVGPGRAIDTDRFRVLGFEFLGRRGPSSRATARISPHDQARVFAKVCDEFSVDRLHAFVGASYGGQVGAAFAVAQPDRLARLVVLCAAHRSHPLATAWRSIQRDIVRYAHANGDGGFGLELARRLAMTTYRSASEFGERFTGEAVLRDSTVRFPVDDYLAAAGRRFERSFTVEAFLALSESLDLHDVDPERIRARTTLIGFDTDQIVPFSEMREFAARIGSRAHLHELTTRYGHDGFLKEEAALAPLLESALAEEVTR